MNQLEFFVASTECARAEVRRYLRQLRELDEWIEYHLDCLRYVTEQRVQLLATSETSGDDAGASHGAGNGNKEEGTERKRRRTSPAATSGASTNGRRARREETPSAAVHRPELLAALDRGTPSSVRSGLLDPLAAPLTGLPPERLRTAYVFHRTRAQRHAEERKAIAAELAERAAELKGAMSVRLAQFEQGVEEESGR